MKKKIVAFMLVIAMLAIAIAGGTLAYFTDTETAKNVMAIGSVDIEQIEQERNENGALVAFTQNKPIVPAVGAPEWEAKPIAVGGGNQKVFDVENVIDKFVFVENKGKSDAYVRTIIAIEAPNYDPNDLIHVNMNNTVGVTMSNFAPVDINGVQYVYAVFTYTEELAPTAKTPVSLAQVYLDPKTTQADVAAYNGDWSILALSQAVQADGFGDAATALNAGFGEVTAAKVSEWMAGVA